MIWNTQPYNFELANKTLDNFLAPPIEDDGVFELQDIEKEFATNKLSFNVKSQICYTDRHGEIRPVYLFMYRPVYATYQGKVSIKYHVFHCERIKEEMQKNELQYYARTETNIVTISPRRESGTFNDIELQICGYCNKMLNRTISDLKLEFKYELEKHKIKDEKNIYGYSMEWKRLSREYRQRFNYTCEKCETYVLANEDKKYIHTHHIDSDKSNNDKSNLMCLCIVCHSNVDDIHKKRFKDGGNKQKAKQEFIKKYRTQLENFYTFS